jgi:hypothetical protein
MASGSANRTTDGSPKVVIFIQLPGKLQLFLKNTFLSSSARYLYKNFTRFLSAVKEGFI